MPDTHSSAPAAERPVSLRHAFLSDVAEIRRRARQQIQAGTFSTDESAERRTELGLLNAALAAKLACVQRYQRESSVADGEMGELIRAGLRQRADAEQRHIDQLVRRILELGGTPNLNPEGLADCGYSQHLEGETLADALAEDLIAEAISIESYREIVHYLDTRDGSTRRLFQEILAAQQEHAADLRSLRERMLYRAHRPAGNDAHGKSR